MTYREAYDFLDEQQEEIISAQMMGRGTYPSKAMEAGFVLLPYSKKFNQTRAEVASRIYTKLIGSESMRGFSPKSVARQAVEYADELMEVLTEDI